MLTLLLSKNKVGLLRGTLQQVINRIFNKRFICRNKSQRAKKKTTVLLGFEDGKTMGFNCVHWRNKDKNVFTYKFSFKIALFFYCLFVNYILVDSSSNQSGMSVKVSKVCGIFIKMLCFNICHNQLLIQKKRNSAVHFWR